MILVTGAGGPTGRAVVLAALRRGLAVRALVHRAASVAELRALAAAEACEIETIVGDFLDDNALATACAGIVRIYHICPNFHSAEVAIGNRLIQCARSADVAHIVYHSVLHPAIEAMPHHWEKMRVEEALLNSGLPSSIVQPAVYMQNLRANLHQESETMRLVLPYSLDARISLVHLQDVGEVAAELLVSEIESGGVYPLVGTPAYSQWEVAEIMSNAFGLPVRPEILPLEEWRSRNAGLDAYKHEGLACMFAYYNAHGLAGSTRILRLLLRREPTSLEAWLASW
jgi:NAD(P)H dehydrogenase (quinone)